MTRIQELEREIELLKEIVRLRKELNNIPQYQPAIYPRWQEPYYYPYQYGTITCSSLGDVTISAPAASGGSITATSGYVQVSDWNKMVDGPASWPKDFQIGYGG